MVNNIVYFGRIITTILLIRLISLIRPIRLIANRLFSIPPSLQGRAGVRLFSCQPLSRHSRATLILSSLQSSVFRPLDSRLRKPDFLPVPKVLMDLRDLRDPFPLGRTASFSNPLQRYFKSPLCVPLMVKIFPKKCIFCVFLPLHKTI